MTGPGIWLRDFLGSSAGKAVLASADAPAYLVGGSVRDMMLGRPVHDVDIAVSGDAGEMARKAAALLGCHAVPIGRPPLRIFRLTGDPEIDVGPLEGADIQADLMRRDLTINAMAVDLAGASGKPFDECLIDPAGGLADLREKRVRFVSEQNVINDPLRMLRFFRFAANLGFEMDLPGLRLIRRHAPLIASVAGERIREEMLRLLGADRSQPAVTAMLQSGLLEAVLPELTRLRGCGQGEYHHLDALDHTMAALSAIEEIIAKLPAYLDRFAPEAAAYLADQASPALLKLAVLLHDIAKPDTRTEDEGGVHFFEHDILGEKMAADAAGRLKLSAHETETVTRIVRYHLQPFFLEEAGAKGRLSRRAVYRFARRVEPHLYGVVLHALADASATLGRRGMEKGGVEAMITFFDGMLALHAEQRTSLAVTEKLLDGRDIMARFGLKPSPEVGRILASLEEARACGLIGSREEALAMAEKLLADAGSSEAGA